MPSSSFPKLFPKELLLVTSYRSKVFSLRLDATTKTNFLLLTSNSISSYSRSGLTEIALLAGIVPVSYTHLTLPTILLV